MNEHYSLILKKVESILKQKKYSESTIHSYTDWIYRFLFFFETKNIKKFGEKEVRLFLKFLEKECFMAPSTINQAQVSILFLYKKIWEIPVNDFSIKIRHSKQKPAILSRNELNKILLFLKGKKKLMISLMYGCGLTAYECVQLRIRNIDFSELRITVEGENCTRKTLLPRTLQQAIKNQIDKVKTIYDENILLKKYSGVPVSNEKHPEKINVSKKFENHYLFPSPNFKVNKQSGVFIQNNISESYLQKTIKNLPQKTDIHKYVCCSSFRHSFATHLIEEGYDIHLIQNLLGHKNLQSTMIYKSLAHLDVTKIISPLDKLMIN